jgi:putative phage-type endonuclease
MQLLHRPRGIEVRLEQGTQEWLDWRNNPKGSLGGSDVSVLTGRNPFKTVEQLWAEKSGLREAEFSEEAKVRMAQGHEREPAAREAYIKRTGIWMRPATLEHPYNPGRKTSLDGITRDFRIIGEIKSPTKPKLHDMALEGEVALYYQDQLQWNMGISGAEEAHFFTYYPEYGPGRDMALVIVQRNDDWINDLFRLADEFQRHVQAGIPPGEQLSPLVVPATLGLVQVAGYAQVGKDTTGKIITDTFGAQRYAYADGLKRVAIEVGLWDGKEKSKNKARPKLIALGDGIRSVHPDVWVNGVFSEFTGIFESMTGPGAVITDCRKLNEVVNGRRAAKESGVPHRLIWIDRPGVGPVHDSERDETALLRNVADRIIVNDVDIETEPEALNQAVMVALSNAGPRMIKASNFLKQEEIAA